MYSDRLQLPVPEYIPVMGFGTGFSTMDYDDSFVKMPDGEFGEEGKYTYRSAMSDNPDTFFHWNYQDSNSSDAIGLFLDAPYDFVFNDTMDGYEVIPSMAKELPQPVDGTSRVIGATEVSKEWYFEVRDGLKWTYHQDTDTSGFPEGHEDITAWDFYETYRLALENQWFRAVSGGGDFIVYKVVNALAFTEGEADWEDVGIKYDEENNRITFIFEDEMSQWDIEYWLASFVMGPINLALYDSLDEKDAYGTTPETTAYNGVFTLTYYEHDKLIEYQANPNYHRQDEYFITGWTYSIIKDAEVRWQEFLAGNLEAATVPTGQYPEYKNDPRLKIIPGTTTFRIMVNGLGTVEAQQAQFPGSEHVPVALLGHESFKQAMYWAIDREYLAWEVLLTSTPQMFHFTDAYMVDPASGVPYRWSDQGKWVGEQLGYDGTDDTSYAYSRDLAIDLFMEAMDDLVAAGTYKSGDVIPISLRIFSGSEAQDLFGAYIKQTFEETFVDTDRNITLEITVLPTEFPDIYFNFMMTGDFDLSIGGISGGTLDAASFLDVYCDDDRGGFTLNWGIDTTTANIPVTYINDEGEEVTELWGFNAIAAALVGNATIVNGVEAGPAETGVDD